MKFLLGLIVGIVAAILIGVTAVAVALGHLDNVNIGDRDRNADITQTFDLADFDRIDIAGIYELDVAVGAGYSIEISGSEDDMARVEARVENGELVLDQKDRKRGEMRLFHHGGLTARIAMPALAAIEVSGVVDADITGVSSDAFRVDISGVADMELAGQCGDLVARVSGVGELDAKDLECANVDVTVSGVGEASVYASQSVDARVGGMGEIKIYGSPAQVEKSGGMFSSITVK